MGFLKSEQKKNLNHWWRLGKLQFTRYQNYFSTNFHQIHNLSKGFLSRGLNHHYEWWYWNQHKIGYFWWFSALKNVNCEDSPWITRTWNHPKNRELQIRELRIRELRGLPVPTFTHKNEIIKKNWNKNTKKSSIFFRRKCYITFFWKMRDFDTMLWNKLPGK